MSRLCVGHMMDTHELGAPATSHLHLKSMRAKGWIVLADADDPRRKQVELSDHALRQLSNAIVRAARSAQARRPVATTQKSNS